jgi:uncharacterized protein with HEPN domain
MSREWRIFLTDIAACCAKIREYTKGHDKEAFLSTPLVYDAVLRNLETIGEAAKNLPDEVKAMAPDLEWRKIVGLRDFVAHSYFRIDSEIIWDVLQNKLPEIERAIDSIQRLDRGQ